MEKVIKGNVTALNSQKEQKYSYEELNQICSELSQQNQKLYAQGQQLVKQLQEMASLLQNKRLDYLLRIVELSNTGVVMKFDADFVQACIDEIVEAITVPETEETEETEAKKGK